MPKILKTILVLIGVIVVFSVIYALFLRQVNLEELISNESPQNEVTHYIIQSKQVGPFKIGDTIPRTEEYEIKSEIIERFTEEGPEEERAYKAYKNCEQHFLIYADRQNDSIIREIFVQSPNYKTDKKIGVSSTLEEFVDAYPDYSLWYTYVSKRYVIESPALQAQFLLDEKDYAGELKIISEITTLLPENFKDSARITSVRLF